MQSESLKSIWTDKASDTEIFTLDISRISRTDIDAAYFSMSEKRRKKCDGLKFQADKDRCIAVDMLLRKVLSRRLGVSPEALDFDADSKGKLYLVNGDCQFNVSHSGDIAAVAVNPVKAVGIDVEKMRPVSAAVARRVFSPSDMEFVFGKDFSPDGRVDDIETRIRFFKVWTYKEAIVKMTGEGISDNFRGFSYDEKRCYSRIFADYVLTVITEE